MKKKSLQQPLVLLFISACISLTTHRAALATNIDTNHDLSGIPSLNDKAPSAHFPIINFHGKIEYAKESFKRTYEAYVRDGYLDHAAHLKMIGQGSDDPTHNGALLIELIAYLEQDDNIASKALLHRCNKLFFLELHKFMSEADEKHSHPPSRMIQLLHDLYAHTVKLDDAQETVKPFQTLISTIATHMFMINAELGPYDASLMYYSEKQACLVYSLEKLRTLFVEKNKALGSQAFDERLIHDFINLSALYGVKEPMFQYKTLQKWGVVLGISGAIGIGIYCFFRFYGWDKFKKTVTTFVGETVEDAGARLTRGAQREVGVDDGGELKKFQAELKADIHGVLDRLGYEPAAGPEGAAAGPARRKWSPDEIHRILNRVENLIPHLAAQAQEGEPLHQAVHDLRQTALNGIGAQIAGELQDPAFEEALHKAANDAGRNARRGAFGQGPN